MLDIDFTSRIVNEPRTGTFALNGVRRSFTRSVTPGSARTAEPMIYSPVSVAKNLHALAATDHVKAAW